MARRNEREATPALLALSRLGVAFTRHEYVHDPAVGSYGAEAAAALGVEPSRVLKTLVVDAAGRPCLALVPVDRSLDLKGVASALGVKRAAMAEPARAERATGYLVGAISPFGQRSRLRTVVEASVQEHTTVFVSAGRRGLEVELGPDDLVRTTGALVAAIAR